MKKPPLRRKAQTFIFFLISFAAIWLLCGIGLDAGMLYLHRIKLGRAVDAAILQGVALYKLPKDDVALHMKHMAEASYDVLAKSKMPENTTPVQVFDAATNSTEWTYTYTAADLTSFTATLAIGSSGQITMARASAISPARTFFMGYSGLSALKVYRVNAKGEAIRRPRMIAMVLDRSGSMCGNSGFQQLPPAVINFLALFDTNADNIAIISYSAFARLEVPLTNKFWSLGTTNQLGATALPQTADNPFSMKFGGMTASDEGMRLAVETMMDSPGWSNFQTLRFLVFFTDGEFNSARTLWSAPAWTNTYYLPDVTLTTSNTDAAGVNTMPFMTNEIYKIATPNREGRPTNYILESKNTASTPKYVKTLDIWLQPGAVNYTFRRNSPETPEIQYSYQYNRTITVVLEKGDSNQLVVPGYILDGVASGYYTWRSDAGMTYKTVTGGDDTDYGNGATPTASWVSAFATWPDVVVSDTGGVTGSEANSTVRKLTARNGPNLWSDPAIFAPEDYSTNSAGVATSVYAGRPMNSVTSGFYPGGVWYWPVDGLILQGRKIDIGTSKGDNWPPNYPSNSIPGRSVMVRKARNPRMSTNMMLLRPPTDGKLWLDTSANPVTSSSYWTTGRPQWMIDSLWNTMQWDGGAWRSNHLGTPQTNGFNAKGQPIGNVNYTGGTMIIKDPITGANLATNYNVMGWSGRPTHYFEIATSKWIRMTDEYGDSGKSFVAMGNAKTMNYCTYIRKPPYNVTVFTIGMSTQANFDVLIPMSNDNPDEFDISMVGVTKPSGYVQKTDQKQGKTYRALPVGEPPTNLTAIFVKIANKILSIVTE